MTHMERIGIRALQQHASAVVARAVGGERIVITDRGRPAALLVPLPGAGVARLVDAGLAVAPALPIADLAPPASARPDRRPLSGLLEEQRADERA